MIIKNVQIYTEYKYFEEGDIYIKDGIMYSEVKAHAKKSESVFARLFR